MWVGAYQVIDGALSIGELIAFNMLSGQVTGPLLRMVNLWQEVSASRYLDSAIGDVLNAKAEPSTTPTAPPFRRLRARSSLTMWAFGIEIDGPPVLQHVSLTLQPGQIVGVVGAPGRGKVQSPNWCNGSMCRSVVAVLVDGVDLAQSILPGCGAKSGGAARELSL